MRAWFLLAIFFVAGGYFVLRPQTPSQSPWRVIAPGVEMRRFTWNDGGYVAPIIAFRFKAARLRVAAGQLARSAAQWRQRERALLAVNGGFFDARNRSLGLRISDGRLLSPPHGTRWGVFRVRNGQARIVETSDLAAALKRGVRYQSAVQCGPILVKDNAIGALKPQWARRTGLGIQADGRVIVAIADGPLSLAGWARCWRDPKGLNCPDALNLDGGPSTQLSLQAPGQSLEIATDRNVPDAIVIR